VRVGYPAPMQSLKKALARKAVRTTAKHTARGTVSKLKRRPVRSSALLALGAVGGVLAGWRLARGLFSGSGGSEPTMSAGESLTGSEGESGQQADREPQPPTTVAAVGDEQPLAAVAPVDDDPLVDEEAEAAAAEAARIGGEVPRDTADPALQPLAESGQGQAEGFELAERQLQDNASHGNERGFPDRDVPVPEERGDVEYGEADQAIPPDGSE
jgi:hypothetical protein